MLIARMGKVICRGSIAWKLMQRIGYFLASLCRLLRAGHMAVFVGIRRTGNGGVLHVNDFCRVRQ